MTIENLFPYPLASLPDMTHEALSRQLPSQRTRNHSGGSTGSQGSVSSYGSDSKGMTSSLIRRELLAYHLSQVQLQGPMQSATVRGGATVPKQLQLKGDRTGSSTSERSASNGHKNVNTTRYKTEMCRPFEESGHCKYGDKCQFAHGRHELRNLSRHPKYKTELCRTYHTVGFCPYGPRCHFVHNEDEIKLGEINQMKHQQVMKQVAQQVAQQQQQVLSKMAAFTRAVPEVTKAPVAFMTAPQQVPRPQTLDFGSLSLSSAFSSPPASVSDASSPSLSPTSMMSDDVFSSSIPTPPPGFSALPTANPVPNMFSFPEIHGSSVACSKTSLTISEGVSASTTSPVTSDGVASLAAGLQATVLNTQSPRDADIFTLPPSPPLSIDGNESWTSDSTTDSNASSKGLRLPIFNMLATFSEIN